MAKDPYYFDLVDQLAEDCVDQEMDFLREVAEDNQVDLEDLCGAVMALEDAQVPKTLAELQERKRGEQRARVLAEAGMDPATGVELDQNGFLPPWEIRRTFEHKDEWMRQIDAAAALESEDWSQWLSTEETYALDDYTGSAHASINRSLRGVMEMGRDDEELIGLLDSALEKYEPSANSVVVYRGALAPKELSAQEWLQHDFQVGADVEFPGYLSTSWDPAVALGFTDRNGRDGVVLEIKTRQGVPLTAVSNFGGSERERLIPRSSGGTVVGVHHNVPFETRLGGGIKRQTVVQIVEYSAEEF